MRLTPTDLLRAISPPLLFRLVATGARLALDGVARLRLGRHDQLHLACGTNLMPGWANADIEGPAQVVKLDLTRPLPAGTGSMSYIYSEHFIEHIEYAAAERLLRECHRVLKPGGVLRVSTPDLARLVSEYQSGRLDFWHDMHWRPASPSHLLNEGMRWWGHQFVFDDAALRQLLERAGFSQITRCAWRDSAHAPLRDLECRPFHGELIYDCTR